MFLHRPRKSAVPLNGMSIHNKVSRSKMYGISLRHGIKLIVRVFLTFW